MILDRNLQRHILTILAEAYPHRDHQTLFQGADDDSDEDRRLVANLLYLEEHGLVESGIRMSLSGSPQYSGAKINAAGLDFLEDDGGLTAILSTVTVKLHADSIRDLMLAKVDAAPLPEAEKSVLKKAITTLSAEALKEAAKRLVTVGLDHAPDAIALLKTLLPAT